MLAPAFEALTDEASVDHYLLLSAARELWPSFLGDIPADAVGLRRCGSLWLGMPDDPDGLFEARRAGLRALGVAVEPWSADALARRIAGLNPDVGPGLFTSDDWRLAPAAALASFHRAARDAGAVFAAASVTDFEGGRARLSNGDVIAVDRLVLATGAEAADLAPELAALTPIKGHILRFESDFATDGPILRCGRGYAAGGGDGLHVGATMEAGRRDRTLEPAAVRRLAALGQSLSVSLAKAPFIALAAVRASSPDGLPMVGPSERPGVFLAAGARRNGWLLAPLVASLTVARLAGGKVGPHAGPLDAGRFAVG
jgi:glycine oxidase